MRRFLGALFVFLAFWMPFACEAANVNNVPGLLLGLMPDEVVRDLGTPDYIKVFDYGPAGQYSYFTPTEWEMLSSLAPAAQGEDVYVLNIGGKRFQYHIAYTPVYSGGRFTPEYRVREYTIYPEDTLTVQELLKLVPEAAKLDTSSAIWRDYGGTYPPALVFQGAALKSLAQYFRRFREVGEVKVQVEVGLGGVTSVGVVKKDAAARYLTIRAAGENTVSGPAVSLQ